MLSIVADSLLCCCAFVGFFWRCSQVVTKAYSIASNRFPLSRSNCFLSMGVQCLALRVSFGAVAACALLFVLLAVASIGRRFQVPVKTHWVVSGPIPLASRHGFLFMDSQRLAPGFSFDEVAANGLLFVLLAVVFILVCAL